MARPIIYVDLAEKIRQAILPYKDGWELPSIRALVRTHGAASRTVHKALKLLEQQGVIAHRGSGRSYVRRRLHGSQLFSKPYPAVALISSVPLPRQGEYLTNLLSALFESLLERDIPVMLLPRPDRLTISPLPGGVRIHPANIPFSALVFCSGAEPSTLAAAVQSGAVVMALDAVADVPGVDCLAVDVEADAKVVVEFLAALGHRRIGFVAGASVECPPHWPAGIDPDAERFSQGMFRAKRSLGLDTAKELHRYHMPDRSASHAEIRMEIEELMRLVPPPTAIVFFDVSAAIPARQTLLQHGFRCPDDVSLVGRSSVQSRPPEYTCMVTDPRAIGLAAGSHLVDRLMHSHCTPQRLEFPSALVEGSSTGRCPPLSASAE